MKRDELRKLRDKNVAELQKALSDAREDLRVFKFDLAAGKVKNIGTIIETRKKIARIMTYLNEKTKDNKNG